LLLALTAMLVLALAPPPDMVRVGGGTYVPLYAGENDRIAVRPFLLDRYAVTNEQFRQFVRANPAWRRSQVKRVFADSRYLGHWTGDLEFDPALAKSPVTHVSWFAARAYARFVGKRLPTQAEWELAGAASEKRADGELEPGFTRRILDWYARPTRPSLPPVGSTYRNFYGAYDMHGLVWEWVDDFQTTMVGGESRGGGDGELFCGAGAADARDRSNYARFMRYAFRSSLKARYTLANLGFRCALDLPPEKKP
jgi:formylglycine-generating enzyme required for sulfatase activity